MSAKSPVTSDIYHLLKKNVSMTVSELCRHLQRARSTLFKDLQNVSTIASYTHAGKHHALASSAKFDTTGLWFYGQIGFSQCGTLRATVVQLVLSSNIGHTHKELTNILRIKTHDTLKSLVASEQISRQKMPNNLYVYLHCDNKKAIQQYNTRLSINTESLKNIRPPSQWICIEILAETIRCQDVGVDADIVYEHLSRRGIGIEKTMVENVFAYYQIKKNSFRNN